MIKKFLRGAIPPLSCILTLAAIGHILIPATVYADTQAPTEITTDTTWGLEGSPYIITNRLTVDTGASLIVDPGVVIRVNAGQIIVNGRLIAEGDESQKIHFTSSNDIPASWGISVMNGQLIFDNVDYRNASEGISLSSASSTISNSEISKSSGIIVDGGTLDINSTDINTVPFPITTFGSGVVTIASTSIEQAVVSFPPIFSLATSTVATESPDVASEIAPVGTITGQGVSSGISIFDGSMLTCVHCVIAPVSATSTEPENGIAVSDSGGLAMANSVVKNFTADGIFVDDGGTVSVTNSDLDSNTDGLELLSGAVGNISSSTIEGNTDFGIVSSTDVSFDARNNWWGTSTGPLNTNLNPNGTGNRVSSNVTFTPWIITKSAQPACCSSIAFIPGIEASRLYELNTSVPISLPVSTQSQNEMRYWEPGLSTNTNILDLNRDGTSIKKDIYTRDIIDGGSLLFGKFSYDVYANFENHLNALVASSTINSWQPLPYDWRFAPDTVAENSVALSNKQSYSMVSAIEQLAKSSKTGKVTIVAHSYGGLVAKELITLLVSKGEAGLVDKLILAASPQLGTPESLAALLHGDDQAIGSGILLEAQTARNLGENMPMAYDLLPSSKYFSSTGGPVVTFDPSLDSVSNFRKIYGNSISSASVLDSFLIGRDGRTQSQSSDLKDPAVLSGNLLSSAAAIHTSLDSWIAPAGISVYQIAGVGIPTLKGIVYKATQPCLLGSLLCGSPELDHQPIDTDEGDNTVIVQSTTAYPDAETFYFNLAHYNAAHQSQIAHQTFLEIPPTQNLIDSILQGNESAYSSVYISNSLPPPQAIITIGVHSPVSLRLEDSSGDYTGTSPDQPPSSNLLFIREEIPNSHYVEFGEGKYIIAPADGSYKVTIGGKSNGSFSLTIDQSIDGLVTASTTYSNIAVSPSTTASLSLVNGSATPLLLDNNGDGTIDATIIPDLSGGTNSIGGSEPTTGSAATDGVWNRLRQFISSYCSRADKNNLFGLLGLWQTKATVLKKQNLVSAAELALDLEYKGLPFNSVLVKKYVSELFDKLSLSLK